MISNIFKANNFLSFGKRNPVTGRQDREHSVAILGSSRESETTKVSLELAAAVSAKLAQQGFDVWTGGCPGVAKAANQAAHEVNPKASWAIHVKRFIDSKTQAIRDLGIYSEKKDTSGRPIVKSSGPERTIALMKECDHTLIFGGGPGSGQELWSNLEAKAYKWSDTDLCANDIVVVNENHYYDNDLKKLDLIESPAFKLGENPKKGIPLRDIVNKEVNIDRQSMAKSAIERVSTDIANHIIAEANKNSDEEIPLYEVPSGFSGRIA